MDIVADIFLTAGAIGAGFYCFVLSRRLGRLNDLEYGVGGAVAVLATQVEELDATLKAAKSASEDAEDNLKHLTERAEAVAQRLELVVASVPQEQPAQPVGETDAPNEAPEPSQMFFAHRRMSQR